jgi:hypothetical protein
VTAEDWWARWLIAVAATLVFGEVLAIGTRSKPLSQALRLWLGREPYRRTPLRKLLFATLLVWFGLHILGDLGPTIGRGRQPSDWRQRGQGHRSHLSPASQWRCRPHRGAVRQHLRGLRPGWSSPRNRVPVTHGVTTMAPSGRRIRAMLSVPCTTAAIRNHADRGTITALGRNGRGHPLYRVGDVYQAARAAWERRKAS